MSATTVPSTARGAIATRRQRPVTAETGHNNGQGRESCPPATRSVQLATTRVGLFLRIDHPATAPQSQPGTRPTRQTVDGG